ncbi:MAG: type I pantothenate kinase [Pseudomonadota bacterium]
MDQLAETDISPYHRFNRAEWADFRDDQPMVLGEQELERLQGLNERLSIDEVKDIYLPLSRLLSFYVEASQKLRDAAQRFLGAPDIHVPYVIGLAGSVAAGKSTTARVLKTLLARWPNTPKVDLVTTDGFLFPNEILKQEGLLDRKGFPESYDVSALMAFLAKLKAGERHVAAPLYSHIIYDIVPEQNIVIDQPDIVIVEGLNVLQAAELPKNGEAMPFVSDFFDFSIYLDAPVDVTERWYIRRFLKLRTTAFRDPTSYFHKYADLTDEEAEKTAHEIWRTINLPNLTNNIRPTRFRADLILNKGEKHRIESVQLRKL